jgi:hypothetical protein
MTTKRREFLLTSIGATLAGAASPAAVDPRKLVSKLTDLVSPLDEGRKPLDEYGLNWPQPPEPEFYSLEALCEFEGEIERSQVQELIHIAYQESLPSLKLLVIAAIRAGAHEIIDQTVKLLAYSRAHPNWSPVFASTDPEWNPEYTCMIRWAAAITLGFMGPAGTTALPALRARLKTEEHSDVRAAVEWAIAEIGGMNAQDRI